MPSRDLVRQIDRIEIEFGKRAESGKAHSPMMSKAESASGNVVAGICGLGFGRTFNMTMMCCRPTSAVCAACSSSNGLQVLAFHAQAVL